MKPIVIPVLLVLASLLLPACNTSPFQKSPGAVVQAFYMAANAGKYSEAEQFLSEDADKAIRGDLGQLAGGFKNICDKNTKEGTIAKVEVQKEEVRGEGSTVIVKIFFKDGSTKDEDKNSLIKEKGAWKLTIGD